MGKKKNLDNYKELANKVDDETYHWLLAHHFDFLGLIDEDLAIDCTGLNIY